jgi:hypothetical protein
MGRRARKIRQAKKNSEKQKMKAAKKARFAAAQERSVRNKEEKAGKWRGINRKSNRNRGKVGGVISLKVFDKLLKRMKNDSV